MNRRKLLSWSIQLEGTMVRLQYRWEHTGATPIDEPASGNVVEYFYKYESATKQFDKIRSEFD